MKNCKVLFINSGPVSPKSGDSFAEKYKFLSRYISGYIITPVSGKKHLTVKRIDAFELHSFLYFYGNSLIRNIKLLYNTLKKAYQIYKNQDHYDVVISKNPLVTGLSAVAIAKLAGKKSLIEINGDFSYAFNYSRMGKNVTTLIEKLKGRVSREIVAFVIKKADRIKLLYGEQLSPLNIKPSVEHKVSVFSNYVAVSKFFSENLIDEKYLLFLGYPWYLKGVDVLIKAFNRVSSEFPEYKLKIIGYCPEGFDYYEKLAQGNTNIEFHKPVFYDKVIKLMAGCSLFILPSRTEAMGRVLLEAMACKKPIIASDVGGIPEVIKDGYNGLLFKSEKVDDLAQKIRLILSNKKIASELRNNAYYYVKEKLSEECYAVNFINMINNTLYG